MQFVNSKVATIKRLTGGVFFTDTIPRAPVSAVDLVQWHMLTPNFVVWKDITTSNQRRPCEQFKIIKCCQHHTVETAAWPGGSSLSYHKGT
jgi:hypothetical protein